MKGVFLSQNDAAAAIGKTVQTFAKFKPSLKQRQNKYKRTEFFIPLQMMTAKMQRAYKDELIEYDAEAQEVENVLGDLTEGIDVFPSNSNELNEARLANIRARTAVLEEKLEQHKQELWNEWNEAVFNEFSESFARVKNALISMHLSEEQLNYLNEEISNALKNLELRLDSMWSKFKNGEDNLGDENEL